MAGPGRSSTRLISCPNCWLWCPGFQSDVSATSNAHEAAEISTRANPSLAFDPTRPLELRSNTGGDISAILSSNLFDEEDSDGERDGYFEGSTDMHSEGYSEAYRDEDMKGEEEEESETGSDKIPAFPQVPNLPTELQTKIYEFATPSPRRVPDAILVFVNFDLSKPRAILPSPEYVTRLYDDMDIEHFESAEDSPFLSIPV